MIRAIALFATGLALSACSPIAHRQSSSIEQAAVDSIIGAYTFGVADASLVGCRVNLEAARVSRASGHTTRSLAFSSTCSDHFPALSAVRLWAWTGGGSIAFFGGDPTRELSDFSPVQDGIGVYLRGGFEGDVSVYELRQVGQ